MLVITGLGRCGMTVLGDVLTAMNYKCGKDHVNYMLPSIHDLNVEMYDQILSNGKIDTRMECKLEYWKGHTYESAIRNCTSDVKQSPVSFIIDPSFMWHPQIFRSWWRTRRDLRVIILHRNFNDIIKSWNRLSDEYDDEKRGSLKTLPYKEDFANCITDMVDMNIPYFIHLFPKIVHDAIPLFRDIKTLGLQTCHFEGNKLMKELRDLNKIHF